MTAVDEWKRGMRDSLLELERVFEPRFGYPFEPTDNFVSEPGSTVDLHGRLPDALVDFYSTVGEVSLPDVHNGYFIHPVQAVLDADETIPAHVEDGVGKEVVTFGSDGGGGLFCVAVPDGAVYHLPPGRVEDGVFYGGGDKSGVVATDFAGFLARLLAVVREFAATGGTAGIS